MPKELFQSIKALHDATAQFNKQLSIPYPPHFPLKNVKHFIPEVKHGLSPLMYAAYLGEPLVVKTLLERRLDPNCISDDYTALDWAYTASPPNPQVVALLHSAGAKTARQLDPKYAQEITGVTSIDDKGNDGVRIACSNKLDVVLEAYTKIVGMKQLFSSLATMLQYRDPASAQFLLNYLLKFIKEPLNFNDDDLLSEISKCIRFALFCDEHSDALITGLFGLFQNNPGALEQCLLKSVSVDEADFPLLHLCIYNENAKAIEVLGKHCPPAIFLSCIKHECHGDDLGSHIALHTVVTTYSSIEVARSLLKILKEHYPNPNDFYSLLKMQAGIPQGTALHYAVVYGTLEAIELLLKACPQEYCFDYLQQGDDFNRTALHRVLDTNNKTTPYQSIITLLMRYCPLEHCCAYLEQRHNCEDAPGGTILHLAAEHPDGAEVVTQLLNYYRAANGDLSSYLGMQTNDKETAADRAKAYGSIETIKILDEVQAACKASSSTGKLVRHAPLSGEENTRPAKRIKLDEVSPADLGRDDSRQFKPM